MSLSFRFRIALWSALLSGTVLLVFLGFTSNMVRKTMTEEADYELKGFTADMVLTAQAMEEGGLLQTQLVGTLSAERAEVRLIELAEIENLNESILNRSPLSLEGALIEGNQIYKEPDWPEPGKSIEWKPGGSNETVDYKDKTWRVMCRTFDGYKVRMAIDLKEIRDEMKAKGIDADYDVRLGDNYDKRNPTYYNTESAVNKYLGYQYLQNSSVL